MVYLSSSQQVFQEQYLLKEKFPIIFAGLAIAMGFSIFLNGIIVMKFGIEKLITFSLFLYFIVSVVYVL